MKKPQHMLKWTTGNCKSKIIKSRLMDACLFVHTEEGDLRKTLK
jgi:hypothetical protein